MLIHNSLRLSTSGSRLVRHQRPRPRVVVNFKPPNKYQGDRDLFGTIEPIELEMLIREALKKENGRYGTNHFSLFPSRIYVLAYISLFFQIFMAYL